MHALISIEDSPASKNAHKAFRKLISSASRPGVRKNNWKPIAIIHGLGHSALFSLRSAKSSMNEWQSLAKGSGRDTFSLWVGPTAPGQEKSTTKPLDNSVWQYSLETAEAARAMGIDALGMYNATLQAESFDGAFYGERVSLLQAMMVGSLHFVGIWKMSDFYR